MKAATIIAALLCILISGSVLADNMYFTFNPADSLSCTGVTVTARTRFIDGVQGPIDTIRTTNHLLFTRTETGYEMLSAPDSITITRNGKRVDDPITSVLAHTPITYVLDSNGQAVEIRGYEHVLDELSAGGKEVPENLRRALDVKMLNAGALTEWDTRVGSMVGMELRVDEMAHSVEEYVTPDGTKLPFFQILKITDTFQVDGQLAARLFRIADTDMSRMADKLGMTVDSLKHIMNIPAEVDVSPREDSAMSWSTDQVIMEVHTMMILGQHSESESILPMTGQDGKVHKVQLLEITDKEYNFKKATGQKKD